jgi:hypothetical protein
MRGMPPEPPPCIAAVLQLEQASLATDVPPLAILGTALLAWAITLWSSALGGPCAIAKPAIKANAANTRRDFLIESPFSCLGRLSYNDEGSPNHLHCP